VYRRGSKTAHAAVGFVAGAGDLPGIASTLILAVSTHFNFDGLPTEPASGEADSPLYFSLGPQSSGALVFHDSTSDSTLPYVFFDEVAVQMG
jgi:hypothetical protein